MHRTLSDIVDLTRSDTPRFREVDLLKLLDEVVSVAESRQHGRLFRFKRDTPAGMPPLRCDRQQVRKLLLNLILNIMQATPEGGDITVAVRREIEPDNIVLSLRSLGRVTASKAVEGIFEPFFTTHDGGLGMGLALAQEIVLAHRGNIQVDDNSGNGIAISVILPLFPADSHEHRPHIGG